MCVLQAEYGDEAPAYLENRFGKGGPFDSFYRRVGASCGGDCDHLIMIFLIAVYVIEKAEQS